ncbi:MAG: geranylgeranyl reductase family protein [Halobacteriales archaeon]|jgi:geranylgeranyl reductase family protein
MVDFVVVGAGPTGSRFARVAAEFGYDVTVFEAGTVGEPLACSGHVSTDLWEYTGPGARGDLLQNDIYGAEFHVRGAGSDAYSFYRDAVVSNVIDRVGLDRHLAALAREAGADIRENHAVTAIEERADSVAVIVSTPDGVETVEARMVAGCDGPRSKVRTELGLAGPDEVLHGVLGFDERPDAGDFVDVHLTVPGFFAWRIPRGEAGVEYGLGAPPGRDVRQRFDRLVRDYGANVTRHRSGAIPIGPPSSVTSRRGFLIGDAAAQTKPFTGGGILYGLTSADHAARTIDPSNPATLDDYETAWRKDLGTEILLGRWIRRAYSLPEPIQRVGLRATAGEIGVHMDRPSSLFSMDQLRAWLSRSRNP